MDDNDILDLYFDRNETAIKETAAKYGSRLLRISENITGSPEDAKECVNDAYLEAWNRIPPTRPTYFFAYLAKITRSLSLGICDKRNAAKRKASFVELSKELSECLASQDSDILASIEAKELGHLLDEFIRTLNKSEQFVFIRRYFWSDSIAQIAKASDMNEGRIRSMLFRVRKRLKKHLNKEGYSI